MKVLSRLSLRPHRHFKDGVVTHGREGDHNRDQKILSYKKLRGIPFRREMERE